MSPLAPSPVPVPRLDGELTSAVQELRLEERAAEIDRAPAFPRAEFAELGRRGLLGLHVAPRLGGRGLPLVETGASLYWFAYRTGTSGFAKLLLQPEFCSVLAELGSEALIAAEYRPLCRGLRLLGNQITEPSAGSDARAITTTAVREGAEYRLSGTKSQAAFAREADAALVYAKVPPHAAGPGGLTAFLVPQHGPGIERSVIPDLGERWMGRGTVRYEGVVVPAERRVGEEGEGLDHLLPELTRERGLLAMIYLGVARRALEETVDHVGRREAFGRPLQRHEAVGFPLVEDWVHGDAATLLTLRTLQRLDEGASVEGEAAMAKWLGTEVALTTLDHAMQFHGGRGYSAELPFERRWRDVRSGTLAHGTSELMHVAAARALWSVPAGERVGPGRA